VISSACVHKHYNEVLWLHRHFCDVSDFEPIIATVAYLIDKNPQCQFWTTYQVRRYWAHNTLYGICAAHHV